MILVRDLLHATKGQLVSGFPKESCRGVSIDTRTLRPGDLYFALHGPRFDGHDFMATAASKGAGAIVFHTLDDRLKWNGTGSPNLIQVPDTLQALQNLGRFVRQRSKAVVIGITGSNGKTTTKEMLAGILRRAGKTLATRGNLNNHIGLPLTLCALEPDHDYAVIEMGTSKTGDMELLADVARPQIGLITNVGKDHLEFLGSPDGVLAVNRKLFDGLPKDGWAIVNVDDPRLAPFAGTLGCRIVTYGYKEGATVRVGQVESGSGPVRFTLTLGKKEYRVSLSSTGSILVLNAVAAAAVAYALGVGAKDIVEGLASFKPVKMRIETHERADGVILVNDAYNANPSSVRVSVESFCQSYPGRPRWVVLGDMRELGALARQEHAELGSWLAKQPLERIFLYGRDTRFTESALRSAGGSVHVERFRKKRYLIVALKGYLGMEKPAVLFKASRKLALEEALQPLL